MPKRALTDARVRTLRPRNTSYDIRDGRLKGFGVRVLPSGRKRFFAHCQHRGERVWKIVGDGGTMDVGEARSLAADMLAAIQRGGNTPRRPDETVFEAAAEKLFRSCERNWKPGTRKVNRIYYRNQILPWFGGMQIADITRGDVQQWFASLRATPAAADRAAPVLSVLMKQAELLGYRPEGSNPCVGIRRYRRKGRERFLSPAEMRRLGAALARHRDERPLHAAAVELLLLTGCRKSEILTLQWTDYREGKLFLRDSKTGPRTVWLSSPARRVLDGLPRRGSRVFPSGTAGSSLAPQAMNHFWDRLRSEAGLDDVTLHDARHSYASVAMMQGETVVTIGKLLGHRNPETTLKYIHLDDAAAREAAEAVAPVMAGRG